LTVFTTRIDTIFGVTFLSIAPENKLVLKLINKKTEKEVKKYIEITNSKTELERKENKTKTGVFTGSYAINPFSNKKIPIYVADYVLNNYATGIVMGVPSCDQRDYEFAQKFNLPIINIIESSKKENLVNIEDGKHINSKFLNSLNIKEAKKKAIEFGVSKKIVKIYTTTKLHD
jgi:leucyl-tRNA synthetase